MTRVVEISGDAVAGVRGDVCSVRDTVEADWVTLRTKARNLGVRTNGFDDVLGAANRLGTHVLPVVDTHLNRARALENLRYGTIGRPIPVLDVEPAPTPLPFRQTPLGDGSTVLTWEQTNDGEVEADRQETKKSRGIGGWFADRWDDVSGAVSDGVAWVGDRAADAWDTITDIGSAIGDWWERTTADLGDWIDQNLQGVRDFIGKFAGVFRFLANLLKIVGWIVVAVGAVLTVVLGILGGTVGFAAGTLLGGVGGVPAGGAGVVVGVSFGLKIVGAGFSMVAVGDFLDVLADWGEGKIDGQDLVKKGALEIGLAVTSLVGPGVIGKILQKTLKHLPPSWRTRLDDWLKPLSGRGPRSDEDMRLPLRSSSPSGPGWNRRPDVEPDILYGQPRVDRAPLKPGQGVPPTIDPDIARLGGDLNDPWGVDPVTGLPYTAKEWQQRYVDGNGFPRWPPNRGAVEGSRVEFTDADRFLELYGDKFDRVGNPTGEYLGVPPGATWGQRALPPGHLNRPVHGYSFSGKLPDGVTIEVSEIAPAFGQPGGGIQVLFIEDGAALTVDELLRRKILS